MKKLMTVAAVAMCGSLIAVESANIVGYKTDTLAGDNFNMIAIPFNAVDGKGIDLNGTDITIANHSVNDDYTEDSTDLIQVWRPDLNGYDDFYFYSDEGKWCSADGNDTPFIECDGYENGLPAGATAWYQASKNAERAGALTITVSGAIEEDADVCTLAGDNFNMVANPYPVAIDLNNSAQVVIANHSVNDDYTEDSTDLIQVWRPDLNGYDDFYFYSDEGKWCSADGNDTPFIECDGYEDGLPAGTAFWYQASKNAERAGALTITFINPL